MLQTNNIEQKDSIFAYICWSNSQETWGYWTLHDSRSYGYKNVMYRIFKNVWYDREQVQTEVSYKEKTKMDDKRIWLLSVWFIIMLHCRTENIIVLL